MFRVRDLARVFPGHPQPVHALRGVNLDVPTGQLTAVLGPSGCGKTTLLRVLAGFIRPDTGSVHLGDRLVADSGVFVRPEQRSVGIVAQEGALFPHMSVAANIAYGLPEQWRKAWSTAARRRRRQRVDKMLELVGLASYGNRRPDELSGGEQQRVALARALAPEPSVVLLDEPFSALDAALRADLREEVRSMLQALGTTAVLVTHDQSEALSMADHVAVMRHGRVIQDGTPREVYSDPVDPEAAAFLGESVELPCRVLTSDDGAMQVDCALGQVCVDARTVHERGDSQILMLRPEDLELADSGAPASVVTTSYFGHDCLARLRLDDGTWLLVRLGGSSMPPVGASVNVRLMGGVAGARRDTTGSASRMHAVAR